MGQPQPGDLGSRTGASQEQSDLLFRSFLLDQVSDAIYVIEFDGRFVFVNNAACESTGYTCAELMKLSLFEFLPEPRGLGAQSAIFALRRLGGTQSFETEHRRKDGSVFPVEIKLTLVDFNGRGVIVGIARDLSEPVNIHHQLKMEREQFRALVEKTSDWLWEVDENAVYTYSSPQVTDILGYAPDEILGRTPFDLMPEAEAKRVAGIFGPIVIARESFKLLNNVNLAKDGRLVALETSGVPIFSGAGEFKGYRGIDRDITERHRRGELNEGMNEISAAISSTFELDQMLHLVLDHAAQLLRCETAAVILREADRWVFRYIKNGARIRDEDAGSRQAARSVARVVEKKELLISTDVDNDGPSMAIPLIARDEVIGVLEFYLSDGAREYTEAEIDFARKLGVTVSLAVENSRLYSAQRDIADTLQEALMTLPAQIRGIKFGNLYRSATQTARVGGDFYDLFELEHERVGIVIGDVSGKGIKAAALTSLVKNTLVAYAYQYRSPAEIISKTNEIVMRASDPMQFVTVFFGLLDTHSGELSYCGAGHPPAIIRRKSGGTDLLDPTCLPIGVFEGIECKAGRDMLNDSDVLVLYTDGVIEARTGDQFFGEDRLRELVRAERVEAEVLPQRIFSVVQDFAGELVDDIAIQAVSRDIPAA